MRFEMIQLSGLCENCSLGCSLSPALSDCFLDRLAINKRNAADRKRWFHQGCSWYLWRTRIGSTFWADRHVLATKRTRLSLCCRVLTLWLGSLLETDLLPENPQTRSRGLWWLPEGKLSILKYDKGIGYIVLINTCVFGKLGFTGV